MAFVEDVTLTLKCNNRCSFCPTTLLADVHVNVRDRDRVLLEVRRCGTGVVLSGGEVTTLPDFFKIVDQCRKLGFRRIGMVTNGRLCSRPAFAKRLIESGVHDIMVSVYSHLPAVHDGMTGKRGSCKETWRGLAQLAVLNMKKKSGTGVSVRVNFLVTGKNAASLVGTVRRLKKIGVLDVLVMDVLTKKANFLADYTRIRAAYQTFAARREFQGMGICFRGYPACIFVDPGASSWPRADSGCHLSWEPMSIKTTLGADASRLKSYLGGFGKGFVKSLPACGGCRWKGRCNGVQRLYLQEFGGKGLGGARDEA